MSTAAPTIALVRLDQVVFHPHNVRQDLGDLRALTASIKRHGVMQPVVVEKHAGRLRLRAGHRRTAAARLAGLARIPAVIHDEALEEDEWLIASVQENVHRQQLSKEERRRTVQALLDLGCTRTGIAEAFGVTVSAIGSWLQDDVDRANKQRASQQLRGWKDGRLTGPKVRALVAEWRERDLDRDAIFAELEALFPAPVPVSERRRRAAA